MSTTPETATAETPSPVDAVDAAVDAVKTLTPEERQQQFQAFMVKIMGDVARVRAQTEYSSRHFTNLFNDAHERMDYIEGCLHLLFDALHLEMPPRVPKLLDAKVEIVTGDLNEGEVCEFRVAYSATAHPVFGNFQYLVGPEGDANIANPSQLNPVLVKRIEETFATFRETELFADGKFYYVRLFLLHSQPVSDASVQLGAPVVDASAEAANDDAPTATESSDVESQ